MKKSGVVCSKFNMSAPKIDYKFLGALTLAWITGSAIAFTLKPFIG